jgi:hypothetical protein
MVIDHTLTFNAPFGEESNQALSKLFKRERLNNQDKTLLYQAFKVQKLLNFNSKQAYVSQETCP